MTVQAAADLAALDARINAILPPQYQGCYQSVSPNSMGSAALKYGADGRVTWDDIWTSFCDLALAGGPPHRGTLLEPASAEEVAAEPVKYQQVVEEIGRGLWLVIKLPVLPRQAPGWLGLVCQNEGMAAWLLRAVTAENVAARQQRNILLLPAGPHFRLAKEIKNVITAAAKSCHHWMSHMSAEEQATAAAVFLQQANGSELLQPTSAEFIRARPEEYRAAVSQVVAGIHAATGWPVTASLNSGWVNVQCPTVEAAVWLLRAVIVENVLARREENQLCLPVNPSGETEPGTARLVRVFAHAGRLWQLQTGALRP
ncbi:MAG: hypothetical protein JNM56_07085 [Planctomycetia bacterium]|nr:hypothetical protein [Planctomycetia bacterium]